MHYGQREITLSEKDYSSKAEPEVQTRQQRI